MKTRDRGSASPGWGRAGHTAPASAPTGAFPTAPHTRKRPPATAPGGTPRWPGGKSSSPAGPPPRPPPADDTTTPRRTPRPSPAWRPGGGWPWRCPFPPWSRTAPPGPGPGTPRWCNTPRRSRCPAPTARARYWPGRCCTGRPAGGRSNPCSKRPPGRRPCPCRRRAFSSASGWRAAGGHSPPGPGRSCAPPGRNRRKAPAPGGRCRWDSRISSWSILR